MKAIKKKLGRCFHCFFSVLYIHFNMITSFIPAQEIDISSGIFHPFYICLSREYWNHVNIYAHCFEFNISEEICKNGVL
jgi:hypothetical protein